MSGCTALLAALAAGNGALGQSAEPAMEKRVLFGAESANQWSAAESSLEASTRQTRTGQPAMHWHITVDHFGGEAKYPIGWPRISRALREAAMRDWSGWDYLQLWLYTDTSRPALPRDPMGLALHTPDKESAYHRPLTELKQGAWTHILVPLAEVPRHHDVRLVQFHISDSNYRHGDKLDLYVEEIALLRYAQPTLLAFAAEQTVMFADADQVPVHFNLAGVKTGESVEVVCELRQNGKTVARSTARSARGTQRVIVDMRGMLRAGNCELVGGIAGHTLKVKAPLRLVPSPWQEKEP